MIGFNGTYLYAACLGNCSINSAAIGGQWVIDGWLKDATKQAIIAAFGVLDGNAVITATNAYLNVLAATVPTKASALEGFINEDPMFVCSLGLQPQGVEMPIRWLVGDGRNAWIDSGTRFLHGYSLETYLQILENINDLNFVIGTYAVNNRYSIRTSLNIRNGICIQFAKGIAADAGNGFVPHRIVIAEGTCYIDDTAYRHSLTITDNGNNIYFFRTSGYDGPSKSRIVYVKITNGQSGVREMYPFIRKGANGMIDIITGTFYPNANTTGSFSIEYTLPDDTPWTPLNQTP